MFFIRNKTDFCSTHHDIRPENIILVRDQSNLDADPSEASKYQFKLADLGNGQFIKRGYGYELRDLAVMDGRGGRNYGNGHTQC